MEMPKPAAPSKPLSFRPPEKLKNQTISSELPYVELKKKKRNRPGQRTNLVVVDETIAHVEPLDNGMVVGMPIDTVEQINVADGEEGQKAIFDFSTKTEKPKKPFVLDPHLTQRPFHDDRLMQLKSRLQRPSFKNR